MIYPKSLAGRGKASYSLQVWGGNSGVRTQNLWALTLTPLTEVEPGGGGLADCTLARTWHSVAFLMFVYGASRIRASTTEPDTWRRR